MARDKTSYDTLQPIRFGKYSGERLCDLPEGYLHWLLCHADNTAAKGPKFRRSLAWALINKTNAKIRALFGPLESRYAFPQPPPGWINPQTQQEAHRTHVHPSSAQKATSGQKSA